MNDVDSEGIDKYMCCICFGTYTDDVREQSGRDWIKCACSRRLHEDCVEDYKVDDSGKDRFCHYCLDMLNNLVQLYRVKSACNQLEIRLN